jgi:hypothetical protein
VNFVDQTLLRLTDEAARTDVFDQVALGQVAAAGYDADALALDGPYRAVVDELRLGVQLPAEATVQGSWSMLGGADRHEVQLRLAGLALDSVPRVDALWLGGIVARTVPVTGVVERARSAWSDPGRIDAEIVAALGSLPADPAVLEAERRARYRQHVRASLAEPEVLTDEVLDRWLSGTGARSVSDLVASLAGTAAAGTVQVTYSAPPTAVPTPRLLPLAALVLIRDAGFSLAELLSDSKEVRARAASLGLDRPVDPELRQRASVLVVWLVPAEVFDDPAWPGATNGSEAEQRQARRVVAGRWLAREGIGLAVPPP